MNADGTLDNSWERRFRAEIAIWSSCAKRARRGVLAKYAGGIYQLHAWDVDSGALRQATDAPQGVLLGAISPDGRFIYYHSDKAGNETGQYVRVPVEGGPVQNLTPDMPDYPSFGMSISGDSNRAGFSTASEAGFVAWIVETGDVVGESREIMHSPGLVYGPVLSFDGSHAALSTLERSAGGLNFDLVVVDTATGQRVADLWDGESTSLGHVGFSPLAGDSRVVATTNRTGQTRPFMWDWRTGDRRDLKLADLSGDVRPLDWSVDGREVLLIQIDRAVERLHIYDLETDEVHSPNHPAGSWGLYSQLGLYFGPGNEIYAHWQDATHPNSLVVLDRGGEVDPVFPAVDVPPSRPWKSISFPSDGVDIQGWLCTPEGAGPFPTILHTHGGPEVATMEFFSPPCQAYIDAGFAFCTINYRGSTTFGRDFQRSIVGEPGFREVADMVAARDWLVQNGVALADQIMPAGASYGGYLTLLALGLHPDLWAGGVAGVPVCDWKMLYEDSAGTLQGYARAFLKGTPEERPDTYRIASPLTYAADVRAPILIIFGRNDSRCPARQVEAYIHAARTAGATVTVHEFEGGHAGSAMDVEEGVRDQRIMLSFLEDILARSRIAVG